jgi:hypothetical protein
MANTTIGTQVELELQDGTKITVRPNPIARQRKFMERINKGPAEDDEQGFDMTMDLVSICLEKRYPELTKDREELEENVDEPTAVKILEVAGGIKMSDPKQLEALLAEQAAQAKTGSN